MGGYTGDANTIANEQNFAPEGAPDSTAPASKSKLKYERSDLGGGESLVQLANPNQSTNIIIKFKP